MNIEISEINTALEPVTLTQAKAHCRVLSDNEDELFAQYIAAAREYAESVTDKFYKEREINVQYKSNEIEGNNNGYIIILPKKCTELQSVKIANGDEERDITSYVQTETVKNDSFLILENDTVPHGQETLKVKYTSYFAASNKIKQAILLLTAHFYENRQEATIEALKRTPLAAYSLLQQERHGVL